MQITNIRIWVVAALLAVSGFAGAAGVDAATAAKVQQAWKLLDYVATDYTGAVRNGAVIDASEYAEQQEFSRTVGKLLAQLPPTDGLSELRRHADALIAAVDAKAAPDMVARDAHALAADLLKSYPVPASPAQAPNVAQGASLYRQQCAACHGVGGDGRGPAAAALNPPPIAFTDVERADLRSPLSLYQAISQGIEGTGMQGYAGSLSNAQRWDLAYYVGSLAYAGDADKGEQALRKDAALRARVGNLAELSQMRVAELAPAYGEQTTRAVIGWLRAHPDAVQQAPKGLALARARLAASLDASRNGRTHEAVQLALSAYLDGVEPDEPRLDAHDHALRSQIETAMGAYRTALARGNASAEIEARAKAADDLLARAQSVLGDSTMQPATAFVGAFTILVREGLEALLVVVALLAFLRKSKQPKAARHVHLGWILALVAGGITWALASYAIQISGAGRELTEGLSSLFAAGVLLCVGLWMHNKSLGGRWQAYLKQKMDSALNRRSAWFLFGLAFISVYREVFETILFYAALWGDGQHLWMLAGMAAAVGTLAVIAWLLLRTSYRLPLGRFFSASSILIAVLAFVLAGKGVAALQEAGWMDVSAASLVPRIEWLGVFPNWQSLLMQLLVLVLLALGFAFNALSARRRAQSFT